MARQKRRRGAPLAAATRGPRTCRSSARARAAALATQVAAASTTVGGGGSGGGGGAPALRARSGSDLAASRVRHDAADTPQRPQQRTSGPRAARCRRRSHPAWQTRRRRASVSASASRPRGAHASRGRDEDAQPPARCACQLVRHGACALQAGQLRSSRKTAAGAGGGLRARRSLGARRCSAGARHVALVTLRFGPGRRY